MNYIDTFIEAIQSKNLIEITWQSKEKGVITRNCIPYDFGVSHRKGASLTQKYIHAWDISSPTGVPHNIQIIPSAVKDIVVLNEKFDPNEYVKWYPTRWEIPRNW